MVETIALAVNLRAYVRRDTDERWIAVCPMVGVASQGVDADDAKRSLQEAVELWFESCVERGVLDQALRDDVAADDKVLGAAFTIQTLLANDDEHRFEVSPELKAVLLNAIAECDRGETISADELLRELE